MAKFVYIYYAGKDDAGSMEAWNAWFGELGNKLVDGGNPFNEGGKIVHGGGVMDPQAPPATGYTIVNAEDMDDALKLAAGCPLMSSKDGAVGVYEALPM
jgi:hypothetical protein